jgi:tRNA pseudouridine32 synthase/23S rRNA pseudouridine746 synthase
VLEPLPPLALLHRDESLVAVDKPPGEPVIAARGEPAEACLKRRLERQLGRRLWVVHRIDRDASGLVVFALSAAAHRETSVAFERREVSKTYLAFVAGEPRAGEGSIDVPLHAARKGKARPARPGEPGARDARTDLRVREHWGRDAGRISLVEARPLTGRHHQIRVHLRSVGTPILFDPLYGRGLMPPGLEGAPGRRLALHAQRLELPSPGGDGQLALEAPLAEDLARLREWLDETWRTA